VKPPDGRFHESLWEIAENHLGDGRRYREIFELNAGRPQPDGSVLTIASLIRPGWVLRMPHDASGPGIEEDKASPPARHSRPPAAPPPPPPPPPPAQARPAPAGAARVVVAGGAGPRATVPGPARRAGLGRPGPAARAGPHRAGPRGAIPRLPSRTRRRRAAGRLRAGRTGTPAPAAGTAQAPRPAGGERAAGRRAGGGGAAPGRGRDVGADAGHGPALPRP